MSGSSPERTILAVEAVFGDLPSLDTPRLLLRRLTLDDAQDVFGYASDPEVARYTTWQSHGTIDDTMIFLNGAMTLYANGQVSPWGVEHKQDRRVIGTCGYVYWLPRHARAEIAYAIGRRYWNQGLMTEAVREIIAFGFRVMQLNRIEARCDVPNIASARVMEKVGMTFEGVLRQHMFSKGVYVDLKLYSILRREWRPSH